MKHFNPLLLVLIFLLACNQDNPTSEQDAVLALKKEVLLKRIKYQPGDPFLKTLKESEFFEISGLKDNVVETQNGTILSIPKAAFKDIHGNIVEKNIRIEVTDIANLEEQILSNISSQYKDKALQNEATLYINATQDGEGLFLNDDSPIHVETPINSSPNNILLFEGIRNEKGEMAWLNPKAPKSHLIPVDLDFLDFLPAGFALMAEKNLPFRNYKIATTKLLDSLYYSFSANWSAGPIPQPQPQPGGQASPNNDTINEDHSHDYSIHNSSYPDQPADPISPCVAIDPGAIKVIKKKAFAATFIATKEFERRLHHLHQAKSQAGLDIYTKNLEKDLSVCDSLVANLLGAGNKEQLQFLSFAQENLGNVKNLPPAIKNMGNYYTQQLKSTRAELLRLKKEYENSLKKEEQKAQKVKEEYKKVLHKRLKYRLSKFNIKVNFKLNKLGWIKLGKLLEPLPRFDIKIQVLEGQKYDRVHVYTIDKRINSIFAFVSNNKILFERGYNDDPYLLYLQNQGAKALVVSYKDEKPAYAIQDFTVTPIIRVNLSPKPISDKELKTFLRDLDKGHKRFNKVEIDLAYQALFYKEKLRQEQLIKDQAFISKLWAIALPCFSKSVIEEG